MPAPQATIDNVIRHIEHVRDVAGIDYVGIASDYVGMSTSPSGSRKSRPCWRSSPKLCRCGWSEEEMAKLSGANVLRAWRGAERLQQERGPSAVMIEELGRIGAGRATQSFSPSRAMSRSRRSWRHLSVSSLYP